MLFNKLSTKCIVGQILPNWRSQDICYMQMPDNNLLITKLKILVINFVTVNLSHEKIINAIYNLEWISGQNGFKIIQCLSTMVITLEPRRIGRSKIGMSGKRWELVGEGWKVLLSPLLRANHIPAILSIIQANLTALQANQSAFEAVPSHIIHPFAPL